ncbi:hypothetical protein MSAN_00961500 [Mycena sanguinolenta]|uniref:F-box domain-containing protein n=1 Tax=Mycena sanguinolenta TaxID=230812 RepID=A0A8H6YTR7_9AGAR|nr:hypothetical protein MSAN_00961500 [Mycena sanguinolenta]
MPFEALDEDILLTILRLSDVYTVLMVSMTNKHLRRITLSKQLWLSLVQERAFRDALELPPPDREDLENRSTEQLVSLVKNAVIGPDSSWPDECSSGTQTSYEIPFAERELYDIDLLPGARYILLQIFKREDIKLYIFDVWTARRLWQHSAGVRTPRWNIDLVPGDPKARVLVARPVAYPTQTVYIEEVDLQTGVSQELFNSGFAGVFGEPDGIAGDFFLCTMPNLFVHGGRVLVNWRTSTFVAFGRVGLNSAVKLIPGYIVSTYLEHSPPHQQILAVTALEAFSNYWQPLIEINRVQLDNSSVTLPITMQMRMEYKNRPLGARSVTGRLIVTPSALHRGAYTVDVHCDLPPEDPTLWGKLGKLIEARRNRKQPVACRVVLSFRFTPTPSPGEPCGLQFVSAQPFQTFFPRAVIDRSNHSITVSYRPC